MSVGHFYSSPKYHSLGSEWTFEFHAWLMAEINTPNEEYKNEERSHAKEKKGNTKRHGI